MADFFYNEIINTDRLFSVIFICFYSLFFLKNINYLVIRNYLVLGVLNIFASMLSVPFSFMWSFYLGEDLFDIITLNRSTPIIILYSHFVIGVMCLYYAFFRRNH